MNPTHNPEDITRILFQDFSSFMMVMFYIVAIAAIVVFVHGCYVEIRKYKRGQQGSLADLTAGIKRMVSDVLSQRTVKRRDGAAGLAHSAIFFGFALLFIGTALITLQYDILDPLTGGAVQFWYGNFYLWFSLVVDFGGMMVVGGLLYMMYRRKWMALPKLDYTRPDRNPEDPDFDRSWYRREDWLFLWSFILIIITGYFLEASRLVWLSDTPIVWDYRWWSPFGAALAAVLDLVMDNEGAGVLRQSLWWFHGMLALTFVALVPRTKIKHIFTAMGSLSMRDSLPMQRLPAADMDKDEIGYNKITDLARKHLLQLDACTKCGRCHEACPANATGYPLSPRDVILTLREHANSTLEGSSLPDDDALSIHASDEEGSNNLNKVKAETLWACRTCGACTEICPVGIEHVPMIVQMRRALIDKGEMDPLVQKTLQSIQKKGNSLGDSKRKRPAWTKKLDFTIKDARKEPVDVLWWVGDYASLDPRSQKVSIAFAQLLNKAGVDFGILYEGEMTAGNDVRRVGEEGLYVHLAESNIELLNSCEFKRMVTTDPHTYNTIRNEYPEFGGEYQIEHASAMVKRLIDSGEIQLDRKLDYRVTYHDPCHLGRYNKGYEPPRDAIQKTGCELIEMPRNLDNSFCCGAGGGRIWQADPIELQKPSQNRAEEAAEIDGLNCLVVSCPKCMTMMEDGMKTTGNEGKWEVKDMIELVSECVDFGGPEAEAAETVEEAGA